MKTLALWTLTFPLLAAEPFVPIGVWYGGGQARAPMLEEGARAKKERWRQDVRTIRSLGFNTLRAWIDWASAEPAPGVYRFDTLDVLAGLAQEEGLRLFVQVYMDSAPEWAGRRYPDSLFVSASGQTVRPESSPGYCRDHPQLRAADNSFYRALAARLRRYPSFLGFDLWSEPHVINWANPTYIPNPEFCFCAHTKRRFRAWLQRRYGSLAELNRAWYRRYAAWNEVEPNRLSTILSYADYIDWKSFIAEKLAEDLGERRAAVKAAAPQAWATSHAAGVGLFGSPHYWEGQSDDWRMAAEADLYGTSFYPKHSAFVDRDPVWRGALLDFTRSFGFAERRGGFVIGEMQAGFGTIAQNVSPTVTPEDLRLWAWSALARGARAIFYYAWYPMSTGYESGGFGMIHLDGTVTERARAAGRLAQTVTRHQALFAQARPVKAEAAVVYNPLAHFVGGRQRAASYGGPQGESAGIERDSLLGPYRAAWPSSLPIDYVHAEHPGDLSSYKLVYLPYAPMLPSAAAAVFRSYVERGGTLVAEARTAWNNEKGRASEIVPGLGLHEVFGCREEAVETVSPRSATLVWEGGARLTGRWFRETLAPLRPDARVAGRWEDGSAAACAAPFGKGRAILVGTYLAAAGWPSPSPALEAWFLELARQAGVRAPVEVRGAPLEARLLDSGGGRLLFVFNHGGADAAASVTLAEGAFRAADLESGESAGLADLRVPARSARVLHLLR
jgi:beta-galactosidase